MLFIHQHSLVPPANTVAPTLTGNLINGQVLTGSDGTWDATYVDIQYRWQSASAPYTTYAAIGGATSASFTLTGTEIGKRIIRGIRVRNADGWSEWADSSASGIVQDSPSLPLDLVGTPITSAVINSPYSFTVAANNGEPAGSPPYYSFSLGGTYPPGVTITPNADGDEATISGPFTSAGNYSGLTVNVTDDAANSDSIGPFSINVIESSAVKLTPGSGWTGTTAALASQGSSANVGWGHKPFMGWADVQFPTLTEPTIIKFFVFTVSTLADYQANLTPVFGNKTVQASVGNGAWADVTATLDPVENAWLYSVLIDPADFPDGTWTTGALREIRVRAVGKNGDGDVLQGTGIYMPGFFFSTNDGGSLTTTTKYVSTTGSDSADGSSGTPYRTIGKAATVVGQGGIIKLKAGNHRLGDVTAELTDNGRWLTIQPDDGLTWADVAITSVGSASQWRVKRTRFKGLRSNQMIPHNANYAFWFDDCYWDQNYNRPAGEDWVRVAGKGPVNPAVGNLLTYYTDTYITNFSFGPQSARLVRGVHVERSHEDVYGNSHVVLNCSTNILLSGKRESSPGVWDGGGNAHPDVAQYNMGASIYTQDRSWGGLQYNVSHPTGLANAQGPFFKDVGYMRRIFIINFDMVLMNSGRNSLYLHRKTENGVLNNTHMTGSMFFNVNIRYGIRDWAGTCDDVVAIDLVLRDMASGANSVPSQMLNYTP